MDDNYNTNMWMIVLIWVIFFDNSLIRLIVFITNMWIIIFDIVKVFFFDNSLIWLIVFNKNMWIIIFDMDHNFDNSFRCKDMGDNFLI